MAVALVRRAGRFIGVALSDAVSLLNPSTVVIGGELAAGADHLMAGIRESVYARSLPLATRRLQIVPAALGDRAGTVGLTSMLTDYIFDVRRIDATLTSRRPGAQPLCGQHPLWRDPDGELDQRPDPEGVQDGADADGPAEQPSDGQHRGLDGRPNQPDRQSGSDNQPGHQPVARAGAQARADVEHRADRVEYDRTHHHRDTHRKRRRRRQYRQPRRRRSPR